MMPIESYDARIVQLVNGLKHYLMTASIEARHTLGTTPETAKNKPLLVLIEGRTFGHDENGAFDYLEHLIDTLEDGYGIDFSEDEEDTEDEEEYEEEADEVEA